MSQSVSITSSYKLPPSPLELRRVLWELVSEQVSAFGARFAPAYAKTVSDGPVVVIHLLSRTPGGKTGEVYKPRFRMATVTSDGDHVVEYYAQGIRCIYRIEVYSAHPEECDRLTDALEDALRVVVPSLQEHGVDEFFLIDQQGTSLVERSGEQIYRNTLDYSAVLERVFRIAKPSIRLLDIAVTTGLELLKDVPLRRSQAGLFDRFIDTSGNEYRDVVSVLYASDVPGVHDKLVLDRLDEVPLEYGVYVPGVDFAPERDQDGRLFILWTDAGRRPAPNAIYYVTFRVLPAGLSRQVSGSDD